MLAKTNELDDSTGEVSNTGNPVFFQFYKGNFGLIRKMTLEYPKAAEMFFFIIEHMDTNNALVVSQHALSEVLNISKSTVGRCRAYLEKEQALHVYKSGVSNIYCVNTEITWQLADNKKKYAKFSANVYLSESEQFKGLRGDKKASKHMELRGHYQKDIFETTNKPDAGIKQSGEFD